MSDSFSSLPKISAPIWRTTFLHKMQDRKIRHIKKNMIFKKKTILLTHQHHSSSPQGQTVAVCCDDRFYIGQVLLPIRPNLAKITFMEQRGMANTFKWPGSDVTEEVFYICILLGLYHHPKEHSVDCRRRCLGDVETEVATTAETSRAC